MATPHVQRSDGHDDDRLNQSFSDDMFFGFLDNDNIVSPESFRSTSTDNETTNKVIHEQEEEQEQEQEQEEQEEKDNRFWETQHNLLQATLRRTSSLESKIRNGTKQLIKEKQISGTACGCGRQTAMTACRSCLMREVSGRLRNDGYNSAVCKSKWRRSPDIPSGEHTFLDVLSNSSSKKGAEVRVIIELNFRAEFEMARASEEFNRLVEKLPEVFVGKVERLNSVIKIMCSAAKKCMREKKMHMGPWRKQRYMQAKWLGTCERTTSSSLSLAAGDQYSGGGGCMMPRPPRVKATTSMLTVDLLDVMPNLHCKAVAVV
ncbi:hypothetical protein TIFTF001_019944 [Ficus carica]|uniref:Uncharacterized protein n=1 Tax=Ficus carica TaxID=3494 RepID=A0AA88AR36_FICCA|nr:hypothetical protein TIFTF001_019944 [Ficus carica]